MPRLTIAWDEDAGQGLATFKLDSAGVVRLSPSAIDAATRLARALRSDLALEDMATEHDVMIEVLAAAARVRLERSESLDTELRSLNLRVTQTLGRAVVVFGIAALSSASSAVVPLGQTAIFGHLSDACVEAIDELAMRHVGHRLPIRRSIDAFWAEDYIAGLEDPQIGEELAEEHAFAMPVLALAVDAIGATARQRSLEIAESVLGAIWILDSEEDWPPWPPWVIGTPTVAEYPRSPDLEADPAGGLLPIQVLEVDSTSRSGRTDVGWRPKNFDIDDALGRALGSLIEVVADADRDGSGAFSHRLAAASRLALYAARDVDPQLAALHSTVGLEALVADEERSLGVTARFVARLSALVGGVDNTTLNDIYAMRSEVVHTGRAKRSFEEAAATASEAISLCKRGILAAHQLCQDQSLRTAQDVLMWLDA